MSPEELERELARTGRLYEATSPLGIHVPRASVRFVGELQGRRVLWSATLHACPARGEARAQRYIEVLLTGPETAHADVGLPVPAIDAPTALKTVIMLRQWKRLAPGRHDF